MHSIIVVCKEIPVDIKRSSPVINIGAPRHYYPEFPNAIRTSALVLQIYLVIGCS
jgi:hypothetical protein